ncbi:asparagine synthase [Paenibacillus sp. CC-CFT747]|nr:asparagine synthase [Paenibacillus sp. CC-CFT747]
MREGLIPAILGTAVTATGAALLNRNSAAAWAVMGFGAAHLVLGAIDLVEHRNQPWV